MIYSRDRNLNYLNHITTYVHRWQKENHDPAILVGEQVTFGYGMFYRVINPRWWDQSLKRDKQSIVECLRFLHMGRMTWDWK